MKPDKPTTAKLEMRRWMVFIATIVVTTAVALSLQPFFSWAFAVPVAALLAFTLAGQSTILLAPWSEVSLARRLVAAIAVPLIFSITLALSYGTLYQKLFAEASSVRAYTKNSIGVIDGLSVLNANAQSAKQALTSLKDLAQTKRDAESGALANARVDTCPARPGSRGMPGPISMFWDAELNTATALSNQITLLVDALNAAMTNVSTKRIRTHAEVLQAADVLNAAVARARNLTEGEAVRQAIESLQARQRARVQGLSGPFDCGAADRDDNLRKAIAALQALRLPNTVKPMKPSMDISNKEEVTMTALVRIPNLALYMLSSGRLGSFEDDSLMVDALTGSPLNRETTPMWLAGMGELLLVLNAVGLARRQSPLIPFDPLDIHRNAKTTRDNARGPLRLLLSCWVLLLGWLINSVMTKPTPQPGWRPLLPNAHLSPREVDLLLRLQDRMFALDGVEHVVVPVDQEPAAANAARMLERMSALRRIGTDVPWGAVSLHAQARRRLEHQVPNAAEQTYDMYELDTEVAQAWRLAMLAPTPNTDPEGNSGEGARWPEGAKVFSSGRS